MNEIMIVLVLFLFTFQVALSSKHDNLSNDYKVSKINLTNVFQDYADGILQNSEELPRSCRKDICYATTQLDNEKGIFHWPEIELLYKVDLRCPYSFENPVYIPRGCKLSKEGIAEWQMVDNIWECPNHPLADHILHYADEIYFARHNRIGDAELDALYRVYLQTTAELFKTYKYLPVPNLDVETLLTLLQASINQIGFHSTWYYFPLQEVQNITSIIDRLLDDDFRHYYAAALKTSEPEILLTNFVNIVHQVEPSDHVGDFYIIFPNIAAYSMTIREQGSDIVEATNFLKSVPHGAADHFKEVTLDFSFSGRPTGRDLILSFMVTKFPEVYTVNAKWEKYIQDQPDEQTTQYPNETETDTRPALPPSFSVHKIAAFQAVGSMIIVMPQSFLDEFDLQFFNFTFEMYAPCGNNTQREKCLMGRTCVKTPRLDFIPWHDACSIQINSSRPDYVRCICKGFGAYTVFYEMDNVTNDTTMYSDIITDVTTMDFEEVTTEYTYVDLPVDWLTQTDVYRNGMLLRTILGCISLGSLLVSVALLFKYLRKECFTTIYMNLCVVLMGLSAVMLTFFLRADTMTTSACTALNAVRYYLVFVALLWNGADAYNKYKICKSNKSKASNINGIGTGIVAWGLPALAIGISFGINEKTFHGFYVAIMDSANQCVLSCQFRNDTLYYAFLLPIGIIFLINFIIFGLAFGNMSKKRKSMDEWNKSLLVELVGSLITLFLLAVPWILVPFGATDVINVEDSKQGIQIAFSVMFNLQGIFILMFQSVRCVMLRHVNVTAIGAPLRNDIMHVVSSVSSPQLLEQSVKDYENGNQDKMPENANEDQFDKI